MSQHQCFIAQPSVDQGPLANYWHEKNYVHPLSGLTVPWSELPPGAMVAHPYENGRPGPDGKMWNIKLPDGYAWELNGPSRAGNYWTIGGEAPNFTASPSIHITASPHVDDEDESKGTYEITIYHGWLSSGLLSSTSDSPC